MGKVREGKVGDIGETFVIGNWLLRACIYIHVPNLGTILAKFCNRCASLFMVTYFPPEPDLSLGTLTSDVS